MLELRRDMHSKVALFAATLCSAIIIFPDIKGLALAQSYSVLVAQREYCLDYYRVVEPSANQRSVELSQFGITVQIPENYRTLLRNNGEVWILNPADYDLIACTARGGWGGQGLYAPTIRSIPNPNGLSLNALATSSLGTPLQGYSEYSSQPYSFSGLMGLLVQSSSGRGGGAAFFVQVPGIQDVLEISAVCDCKITGEDITSFLDSVSLLE